MDWIGFDSGSTIGQTGSESGVISRDLEHPLGARITLEGSGSTAPYSITCGVYGAMVHTRFFSTEQEASREFELMADALDSILSDPTIEDNLIGSIGRFVEQFP